MLEDTPGCQRRHNAASVSLNLNAVRDRVGILALVLPAAKEEGAAEMFVDLPLLEETIGLSKFGGITLSEGINQLRQMGFTAKIGFGLGFGTIKTASAGAKLLARRAGILTFRASLAVGDEKGRQFHDSHDC